MNLKKKKVLTCLLEKETCTAKHEKREYMIIDSVWYQITRITEMRQE